MSWTENWSECISNGIIKSYRGKVRFGNSTCPSIKTELHFTDFFIDLLHESRNKDKRGHSRWTERDNALNDEVNYFVLQHSLRVGVRYEERYIITLQAIWAGITAAAKITRLNRLSPQYDEALCSLHHETRELVTEDALNFVRLLDPDAETDGIDWRLNQDTLVFISRYRQRVQQDFFRSAA